MYKYPGVLISKYIFQYIYFSLSRVLQFLKIIINKNDTQFVPNIIKIQRINLYNFTFKSTFNKIKMR